MSEWDISSLSKWLIGNNSLSSWSHRVNSVSFSESLEWNSVWISVWWTTGTPVVVKTSAVSGLKWHGVFTADWISSLFNFSKHWVLVGIIFSSLWFIGIWVSAIIWSSCWVWVNSSHITWDRWVLSKWFINNSSLSCWSHRSNWISDWESGHMLSMWVSVCWTSSSECAVSSSAFKRSSTLFTSCIAYWVSSFLSKWSGCSTNFPDSCWVHLSLLCWSHRGNGIGDWESGHVLGIVWISGSWTFLTPSAFIQPASDCRISGTALLSVFSADWVSLSKRWWSIFWHFSIDWLSWSPSAISSGAIGAGFTICSIALWLWVTQLHEINLSMLFVKFNGLACAYEQGQDNSWGFHIKD